MPRRDGNGPAGSGSGQGGGQGRGGRPAAGRGGMGGIGVGLGGECVCPRCGQTLPHRRGMPCSTMECPRCRTMMVRPLG